MEPTTAPFTIKDEQTADWFLAKLANIEAEKARIVAGTKKRVDELDADARALHSRFAGEFQAWAQAEAERRRRKTVTLPNGAGVFRTQPRKLIVADNETAFVHARTAFPECVKRTEPTPPTDYLDAAAYIKEAERTGELLPGLDAQPERETFKIDIATTSQRPALTDGGKGKEEAGA